MAPYISNIPEAQGTSHASLAGKVVLLTGIGQSGDPKMWGNGAATARILCGNGAKVFGCDLRVERAEATRDRIRAEGGEVEVCAADVTKKADVQNLVKRCVEKYGRIDILVNNVGMSEKGAPGDMEERVWDMQVDVNLKSVYLCCHEVIPLMEAQGGGVVVNVSSIAGMRYIGKPQVAYAATKAAVVQFTKVSSVIYAAKGIRINVVVPGLMNTPLVAMLADKYAGGDVEGFKKTRNNQVPTGKMGDPFDIANAAAFLASDAANYVTGAEFIVDGAITNSTGRT
ncbi:putative short-chain dehydrogenases/reductase [Rhizodiscina lignyota]|uniref:Short-chain dehydrogenases/reductase n=1 Tax=Rhizodiscina lignyota TaxID=1504668 RepID=A0A9P4IIE0_9PEZI|nr:putative short-chain dehydrogenases/reductase [Rhizodiscina lignyota]